MSAADHVPGARQRIRPFLLSVLLLACAKGPPRDEAALRAEDKRELEQVVAIDVRASQAMRDADDATRGGDAGGAAVVVASRAVPAVDDALLAAERASVRTEWGKSKRQELIGILRDRKAEMPKYEEAVRTGDPEKMLAAIQAQASIERRALATVGAVHEGR